MTLNTPVAVCRPSFSLGAAEQQLLAQRVTLSDWKVEMDRQWKSSLFTTQLNSSALVCLAQHLLPERMFCQFDNCVWQRVGRDLAVSFRHLREIGPTEKNLHKY